MGTGVWLSLAAIGVAVVTVLRIRCVEKRMNAEYERQERAAMARFDSILKSTRETT